MDLTTPTPPSGGDIASPDRPAPRPAPHVAATTQADRTILLDMHRGRYYSLDEVGGRIWTLLEEGAGLAEIEDRLAGELDASRERIVRDLEALLDQLLGRGLVS